MYDDQVPPSQSTAGGPLTRLTSYSKWYHRLHIEIPVRPLQPSISRRSILKQQRRTIAATTVAAMSGSSSSSSSLIEVKNNEFSFSKSRLPYAIAVDHGAKDVRRVNDDIIDDIVSMIINKSKNGTSVMTHVTIRANDRSFTLQQLQRLSTSVMESTSKTQSHSSMTTGYSPSYTSPHIHSNLSFSVISKMTTAAYVNPSNDTTTATPVSPIMTKSGRISARRSQLGGRFVMNSTDIMDSYFTIASSFIDMIKYQLKTIASTSSGSLSLPIEERQFGRLANDIARVTLPPLPSSLTRDHRNFLVARIAHRYMTTLHRKEIDVTIGSFHIHASDSFNWRQPQENCCHGCSPIGVNNI
jgi:hypothetical protein